jgi:hypothetical protein
LICIPVFVAYGLLLVDVELLYPPHIYPWPSPVPPPGLTRDVLLAYITILLNYELKEIQTLPDD